MKNESISKVDVIDLILESQSTDFDSENPAKSKIVINASNFFTKGNIGGPIDKVDWLKMIKGMAKHELLSHKAFLEKLTKGEKVDANPFEGVDTQGRNYLWATFRYKNGKIGRAHV